MADKKAVEPVRQIENRILNLRRQRVMLDADLADLYGVPTKALNQAVKRNRNRFPEDFMFRLSKDEKQEAVTNCDHLARLKFSAALPYAFTEHGAIMAANVLNSERAVEMSVYVVRAFIRLRALLASHEELARKLDALERRYDSQFKVVLDAIRKLMTPSSEKRKNIGFVRKEKEKI